MLSRRDMIAGSLAAGALACTAEGRAPAAAPGSLDALLDNFMQERLAASPETVTSLGFDKGAMAAAKHRLDDNSAAGIARDRALTADQLRRLTAFDRRGLTGMDEVNYDAVRFGLEGDAAANRAFAYGGAGGGSPYVLSQLNGAYESVPTFLDTEHLIDTADDALAYLDRLAAFPRALDNDSARAKADAAAGVVPPDFLLDRTLEQLTALRAPGADTATLVTSLVRRTTEKGIAGDWQARAAAVYSGQVQPALDRQIATVRGLRASAGHAAGVARLPDGRAYYANALRKFTTSSMAPAEVHRLGLEQVAAYGARIDPILRAQGMTDGTVGARLAALSADPRQLYADNDTAKAELVAHLNTLVAAITPRLPQVFADPPHLPLEIRRVPPSIEAGAPLGYYNRAALDGSRPAIYYINLHHTDFWARWMLPTVTFHEGVPGHHLQLSVAQNLPALPLIRKTAFYSGYGEGWALYAEQLADELGMYDADPLGRVGYLRSELWRAARMVVDTGLHDQGWSREQGIRYLQDEVGLPEGGATNEVERYCAMPGQAPSYKIGHTVITRLRDEARAKAGARFDVRRFHGAVLGSGAVPLDQLEGIVRASAMA